MSAAKADLLNLNNGKNAFESQRERRAQEPKKEERVDPQEQFEGAIKALPEKAKSWLRAHPEYMTDPQKNQKIQTLHNFVTGIEDKKPFTDEYFDSIEMHLGLKKKSVEAVKEENEEEEEVEEIQQVKPKRQIVSSAPPSRDSVSPSGQRNKSNKIELSVEEQEVAHSTMPHLSPEEAEAEYARQKKKLHELKSNGHYNERG